MPFSEALAIERELQQLLFQSSDAKEGLNSYVEKRMAKFTNRSRSGAFADARVLTQ